MANFLNKIPDLMRYGIITRVFTGGTALKQIDDAWRATQGKDLQTRATVFADAIQAALARVPQAGAQLTQDATNEAEDQFKSYLESQGAQIPNISSLQIPSPAPASSLSQVSPLRQRAAQDPGVAQALGIQGATAGLL